MPPQTVYREIRQLLNAFLDAEVTESTRERLALLVMGILSARNAAPARVAQALHTLGLTGATAESIERRIRRSENDPHLQATTCFHPLARAWLCREHPSQLLLVLDPTCQEDRVVMVSVAVWYRGRALPLAWMIWPGNTPLTDTRFWERLRVLLAQVATLLPRGVPVTWLADRAFGTPSFIDLLTEYGWHYLVRVQGHTRCRTRQGREQPLGELVRQRGARAKLRGEVFKKRGWRAASVVVYWGRAYKSPLCLVSDLAPAWALISLYRRRYAIEATFRHYKSYGWRWEQGQVTLLPHLERLLVGMALATWIAVMLGAEVAAKLLAHPPTGRRHTKPWAAKHSLFALGVERFAYLLHASPQDAIRWCLGDWEAPNWEDQITQHHAYAFIFGPGPRSLYAV
jgi:hypothetical protein